MRTCTAQGCREVAERAAMLVFPGRPGKRLKALLPARLCVSHVLDLERVLEGATWSFLCQQFDTLGWPRPQRQELRLAYTKHGAAR